MICITYVKKVLRGQSKSKAYLMVRKSDNLCVIVILMELMPQPTRASNFNFILI